MRGLVLLVCLTLAAALPAMCRQGLTGEQRQVYMEMLVDQGIASGRSPKHWLYGLCKFQAANGLLVTGMYDRPTRKLLESQGAVTIG